MPYKDEYGVTCPTLEEKKAAEDAAWGLREAHKFARRLQMRTLSDWAPTDDFVIRFDDKTGEERTPEQIDEMLTRIKALVNEYDFDISCTGAFFQMAQSMKEELELINDVQGRYI